MKKENSGHIVGNRFSYYLKSGLSIQAFIPPVSEGKKKIVFAVDSYDRSVSRTREGHNRSIP